MLIEFIEIIRYYLLLIRVFLKRREKLLFRCKRAKVWSENSLSFFFVFNTYDKKKIYLRMRNIFFHEYKPRKASSNISKTYLLS